MRRRITLILALAVLGGAASGCRYDHPGHDSDRPGHGSHGSGDHNDHHDHDGRDDHDHDRH